MINQGRRDFLMLGAKTIAAATAISVVPGVVIAATKLDAHDILETQAEALRLYSQSVQLVGQSEIDNFIGIFGVPLPEQDPSGYIAKVKEVQSQIGTDIDGVIGRNTLKSLYTTVYSNNSDLLVEYPEIAERWRVYNEVSQTYKGVRHTRLPDVFNKGYYYGVGREPNSVGTHIDSGLQKYIGVDGGIEQRGQKNHVIVKIVGGKHVFLYYNNNKELEVASVTTLGKRQKDGTGGSTPRYRGLYLNKDRKQDINHTSSKYPAPNGGAPMPYANHVSGGIWIHVGYTTGYKRSHGCMRLPYLYASYFYGIVDEKTTLDIIDN